MRRNVRVGRRNAMRVQFTMLMVMQAHCKQASHSHVDVMLKRENEMGEE